MQSTRGVAFIVKEMVKHLVNLLFVNGVFIFLVHKRKKSAGGYNTVLIDQPTNYFEFSAALIGITSAVVAILLVAQFDPNLMVVIAAVFISLGTGRQIFASALDVVTTNMNSFLSSWASTLLLLAKNKLMIPTTEWGSIETKVEMVLISMGRYNLPVKLNGVKPESLQMILEYLNEHKGELDYPQDITSDASSCLAFAQHATHQMKDKLLIYNDLEELQERSGGINAVILIALGTLIWLIS
ncbi:MAG: hypothetical protein P0116_12665 [Candidatus Nitrosocosmicus sp.]|nr:hypothetical protein [Candidatus Nitrosocosmicus sp.]